MSKQIHLKIMDPDGKTVDRRIDLKPGDTLLISPKRTLSVEEMETALDALDINLTRGERPTAILFAWPVEFSVLSVKDEDTTPTRRLRERPDRSWGTGNNERSSHP